MSGYLEEVLQGHLVLFENHVLDLYVYSITHPIALNFYMGLFRGVINI